MSKIQIKLTGIAAELTLGNYMPTDTTIFNNWEEFYHYNDLIHSSQLLANHISEIEIKLDNEVMYTGQIPASQIKEQKSISPLLVERALYLRTECAENAVFQCDFETDNFDKMKLFFETQDHNLFFKVGNSFLSEIIYDDKRIQPEWISGKPVGNICVLCRFENGYLMPLYDAIKKLETK